jgi:cell division protein FtsQ
MQLKVYHRDNRKRDQLSWRRRLVYGVAAVTVAVLAVTIYRLSGPLVIAARSLREFVTASPYFAVRVIQVRGGERVDGDEIVRIAGLHQGMNIWDVDPAAIERKVASHPWVRKVLVRREFPRRVVISVEERAPKMIVTARRLYYIDADGRVFKEVESGESVKFPMLTGVSTELLLAGDAATRKRVREAVRVADLMGQRARVLSEIHFEAPDRLVLFANKLPVALRMGWGEWEVKLARLDRLLELWKGHEERLASLDMSFRDQVVARLRTVQQ